MSIEKSRSKGIDGQWIRDNETKEFEYEYSNSSDVKISYQKAVEMLALEKIKNELIFDGKFESQLRAFARDGITISRQQLIDDINKEVAKQRLSFGLDDLTLDSPAIDLQSIKDQAQIDELKNKLESVFGGIESSSNIESVRQDFSSQIEREEYFDEMYDLEIQKLIELKKNNDPNYEIELNNAIKKISSFTDRIYNVRSQIESDIRYQMNKYKKEQLSDGKIESFGMHR